MPLKAIVDSLDAVPEALRDQYEERGGKFHLSVDGLVPKARVDEFRTNNIDLKRQLDELQGRYEGVDPEKYRELAARAAKERDKELIDSGKVDELIAERVNAMKAEHDKVLKANDRQVKALTEERARANAQLEDMLIGNAIRDAGAKAGVRATAMDDLLLRGRAVFRLHEGVATAFDGDKPIYGKDGEPMPIAEWVVGLQDRAPHLFEPSNGGGARGAFGSGGLARDAVRRGDNSGFLANLDAIASGKVKVV